MRVDFRWDKAWTTLLVTGLGTQLLIGAESLQLVSVPDPKIFVPPSSAGGDSGAAILSPDGRYIVFAGSAGNLVSPDSDRSVPERLPHPINVYLRDRGAGTTTLVSVDVNGHAGGNANSLPRGLSTNGQFVLFESVADNLVPGDTNNASDVFVRDLLSGKTILVSVNTNGVAGNRASKNPVLTPDGRFVAFASAANDLVPGDTNRLQDVFVRELPAGTTVLASFSAASNPRGAPGGDSDMPVLTPDGRFVAFSTGRVPGPFAATLYEIYRRDLLEGTTAWVSAGATDTVYSVTTATNATAFNHAMSDDGQTIVYEAEPQAGAPAVLLRFEAATGLTACLHTNAAVSAVSGGSLDMTADGSNVAFVANGAENSGRSTSILIWDAASGTNTLASGDLTNGIPELSDADAPTLDDTGRYVAFVSSAPGLVTNRLSSAAHLYVRDLETGATVLVDADPSDAGSGVTLGNVPSFSSGGRFIAFGAPDGNLVSADHNGNDDVFTRDMANGTSELISAAAPALQSMTANGANTLSPGCISADGRFVVFRSTATNLVAGEFRAAFNIFVRDLALGTNILVSVNTNGLPANANSTEPVISADGNWVAFTSSADDLVPGIATNVQNVFARNLREGMTTLVSINADGHGGGNADSSGPTISSDGRFVLFGSMATNLAPITRSPYRSQWFFMRDLKAHQTHAIHPLHVDYASMTPDGHFVAFSASTVSGSTLDSVCVWDSLAAEQIFTHTLDRTQALAVAISPDGHTIAYSGWWGGKTLGVLDRLAGTNFSIAPSLLALRPEFRFSADGNSLVYVAEVGSTTVTNQIGLYDFLTGSNHIVSCAFATGAPANANSYSPDISPDGRFIAYHSAASDLVPNDTNGVPDVFIYDRLTSTTTLLTSSRFGPWSAANRSMNPVFSPEGKTLYFVSAASDLLDHDFNNQADIFAYNIVSSDDIPVFQVALVPGGQGIALTWSVPQGTTCQVQFKNSLDDPEWQDLKTGVTIVGTQGYLHDSGSGPQKFYRVVAHPLLAGP